ncbi:MAG: sensor domain-containing protein [Actinomycetota bacterium]|nr:sensor domain-containing protein [Actinomycetota bacterium]
MVASVVFALPAHAVPPKARVLSSADVPASFGQTFSFDFSKKPIDYVKNVTLCTDSKGGPLAFIPASTPQYSAKNVMKPQKKNVFTSVNERVFVYPSAEAAAAAYTQLAQEVLKCTGTMAGPVDEDPKVSDTYANGSSPGGQYQNFWVQDSTVFKSKDPLQDGKTVTFTVYSQAGDAVIQTDVYIDGRPRVKAAQKVDLQQLSMTLSSKWAPQ